MPRPPSVLWTAPWRRAPLLLRRSPAVLVVVASHDPEAWRFVDRILYLADGELTERSP